MNQVNYRLWLAIASVSLFPALYSTARIYFLNTLPETWHLSIAAQAAWLHLAYEVLQEAILLPLYFVFGKVIDDRQRLCDRVSHVFVITLLAFAAMTLGAMLTAEWLTAAMAQQAELQELTAQFIRLEALAILISTVNDICAIVIVALGLHRLLLLLVAARAAMTVGFDALFVGQFSWSFDLGALGVAVTNIAVGTLLLLPSIMILRRLGAIGRLGRGPAREWIGSWLRVALKSGLESAVRNLAFAVMILRLMNEVAEAGLFWVTNGFIWNWLLLPILTLGTLVRQDAGNHAGALSGRLRSYLWLTTIIVAAWVISIPGWSWFAARVMGSPDAERVADLALLMIGFYVVFSFNHILDSYLYGVGRTDLMLYQSLCVSIIYYGAAFVAYNSGVFEPNLQRIAVLFGGGIVIDSMVTLWQFQRAGYFDRSTARDARVPKLQLRES